MAGRLTATGRYLFQALVPFAREVPADQRDAISCRLERLPVAHEGHARRETEYHHPDAVTVSPDEAIVEFTLTGSEGHTPADVLSGATRQLTRWQQEAAPLTLTEPTRAGGEAELAWLTDARLGVDDRGPRPTADGQEYLVAYPDDPLSPEAVTAIEAHTGDRVMAGRGWLAVAGLSGTYPPWSVTARGQPTIADVVEQLPTHRLPESDLADRYFWNRRDLGTLAAVDDEHRTALREYAQRQSPHAPADDVGDGEEVTA